MEQTHTDGLPSNVRAEMARRGLTQASVATELGLNQQQLSRRLVGRVEFTAGEVRKLATYLGVPVGSLYGEAETPQVAGQ